MGIKTKFITISLILTAVHANQEMNQKEGKDFVTTYLKMLVLNTVRNVTVVTENLTDQTISFDWKGCKVVLQGRLIDNNKKPESDMVVKVTADKDNLKRVVAVDALSVKDLSKKLDEIARSC